MKKILFVCMTLFALHSCSSQYAIFELEANQSMSMTGKGPGQDAAINPYMDGNSMAVIKNIGKNDFLARIQKEGTIIRQLKVEKGAEIRAFLRKGEELYFDSNLPAKAKLKFEKADTSNGKVE